MIDLPTATETAVRVIAENDLYVGVIQVSAGSTTSHRWDEEAGDFTKPVLPEVSLIMFSRPAAFLAWAEFLQPDRIAVERRELDTCLHAHVDRDGITWSIHGALSRPRGGQHLPGISVDWIRQPSGRRGNHAWLSLADLRIAMTALGVAEAVAA